MTNLEFIEKEIKYEKERIKIWDSKSKSSQTLTYLQQIKTDLEAWEVVKKYVKEISINGIVFEHIINVSHTKQNYEIVKKALEVDDEKKHNN